jgi:hypothetical protein
MNVKSVNNVLKKKIIYPPDVQDAINTIAIEPTRSIILGSYALKSQKYNGDIDIFNIVKMSIKTIIKRIQQIISDINQRSDMWFMDCKCGIDESRRIINENAYISNGKTYKYNYEKSITKLEEIKNKLTKEQYKLAKDKLTENPNEVQLMLINKVLKFHNVRWTALELAKGYKMINNKKYTLQQALKSQSLFKIDTIKIINSILTDVTCVYDLRNKHNKKINHTNINPVKSIKHDIKHYTALGQPFKVLKRQFSLARMQYQKNPTNQTANKLIELNDKLNTELGLLYQLSQTIEVINSLVESYKHTSMKKIESTLVYIINKLNQVTTNDVVINRITKQIKNILISKTKAQDFIDILSKADEDINRILNTKARKLI